MYVNKIKILSPINHSYNYRLDQYSHKVDQQMMGKG